MIEAAAEQIDLLRQQRVVDDVDHARSKRIALQKDLQERRDTLLRSILIKSMRYIGKRS